MWKCGGFEFPCGAYIMGVLNVTPDSFSDGGKWNQMDAALRHVEDMLAEGMDIVDIGGESTRPGYTLIPDQEEIDRVVPMIEAIKARFDVPISLDTYKSAVAKAGLSAGADLVNDIWGFKHDSRVAEYTAKYGAACCLMHNRNEAVYDDFQREFLSDLQECIAIAKKADVADDKIILDPGVGFGIFWRNGLILATFGGGGF